MTSSSGATCPSAPFRPPSPSSASGPPVPRTRPWRPELLSAWRSSSEPSSQAWTLWETCSCCRTPVFPQISSPPPPWARLSPPLPSPLHRPMAWTRSPLPPHQRAPPASARLPPPPLRLLLLWSSWPRWLLKPSPWREGVEGSSGWPSRAFCSRRRVRASMGLEEATLTTRSATWTLSGASTSAETFLRWPPGVSVSQ